MRRLLWIVPCIAALVPFARLALNPASLIADANRPSVDRALPPDSIAPGNDLTRLFLPHHAKIAQQVAKHGSVPGWDPSGFGGRPLVGNPQAGLWYPPVWLVWRFWTHSALGWLTVAHLAFGGVGVFVLCRSLRIRPFASAIAGALWSTAPYVLAQTFEGHYPHIWAASYQPWAVWAALGWRERALRAWLLPPIFALAALTGHLQETYYLGLLLGIWLFAEIAWRKWRRLSVLSWSKITSLSAIVLLTAGLVAIEVVPAREATAYSRRGLKPTASDASKYHVHVSNLIQLASPLALGGPADYRGEGSYWESLLSIGAVPLALLTFAIARSKRRRLIRVCLAVLALTVLFAFGRGFGVFDVLFQLAPGMGRFRVPARVLFLSTLAACVLVGIGLETLQRANRRRLAAILGLLAVCETCFYGFSLIQISAPEQFLAPDPVGQAILDHRPPGPFRVRTRDAFYGDAPAAVLGLEKTNINDSYQIGFAADLYERLYPMFGAPIPTRYPDRFRPKLQADILSRMNVELLISDRDESRLRWPVVAEGDWKGSHFKIWRNPDPLPRAYVVPRSAMAGDGPGTVDEFTHYPAREFVLVARNPMPINVARQPFTPAEYRSVHPDRVEVDVVTSRPGLLVVADTWMPGWTAVENGGEIAIFRGNRSQRMFVLANPGKHHIVMTYTPPGLAQGKAIALAAAIGWLACLVLAAFHRRRPVAQPANRLRPIV